jgi:hypothetical protein
MPRAAREKSKTGIYHMILRGVNRVLQPKEKSLVPGT